MITVIRRLQFCAGHRVVGHEGKCRHPHGHNYVVYLHARSSTPNGLDEIGRVIDFSVLKARVGGWIEENWDHAFIVWEEDTYLCHALASVEAKVYHFPRNPTAEELARYLLYVVCPTEIESPIQVHQVDVEETENCMAVVRLED